MNKVSSIKYKPARIATQSVAGGVLSISDLKGKTDNKADLEWIGKTAELVREISKYIDSYQFNLAAERLYEFIWHEFADKYIEDVKNRIDNNSFLVLGSLFIVQLKLLHPLMPFITEELYQKFMPQKSIMIEEWPIV